MRRKILIMANNLAEFQNNRTAIEQRILGAVIQYFVMSNSGIYVVTAEGLQNTFSTERVATNTMSYYQDTLVKVGKYFHSQCTDGSWSDLQCTLACDIYRDYCK